MTDFSRRQLTDNLKALIATVTARPTEIGRVPVVDSGGEVLPYSIIYAIPGGSLTGPWLVAPTERATCIYQVTCVGQRSDQAQGLMDKVRAAIYGRDATGAFLYHLQPPAGFAIMSRGPNGGFGGDDLVGLLYQVPERFEVVCTPA